MSIAARSSRPREDQPHYGAHLGDTEYWAPYVLETLARHGLSIDPV